MNDLPPESTHLKARSRAEQISESREEVGKQLSHREHAREKNKIYPHSHHRDYNRDHTVLQNKRQLGAMRKEARAASYLEEDAKNDEPHSAGAEP